MATTNTFPTKLAEDGQFRIPEMGGTIGYKAKNLTYAAVEKV
jgi:hypothetical protein